MNERRTVPGSRLNISCLVELPTAHCIVVTLYIVVIGLSLTICQLTIYKCKYVLLNPKDDVSSVPLRKAYDWVHCLLVLVERTETTSDIHVRVC